MTPNQPGPGDVWHPAPARDDLFRALLWPALLRVGALALRPARVGLALVALVIIALIVQVPALWLEPNTGPAAIMADTGGDALGAIRTGVARVNHIGVAQGLRGLFVDGPARMLREYPWTTLLLLIPVLLVWCVLGGAISRSAAEEFSSDARAPWTDSLAFALRRWRSFLGVKLGALLIAAFLLLGLASVGWLLLRFAGVQVVGGVAFILALICGLIVVLLLAAFFLGCPMLVPALACEGSDAIDATQRTLAYVYARPLRLVLYIVILLVQLLLVTLVLGAIVEAGIRLASWAVTAWLHNQPALLLRNAAALPTPETPAPDAGWSLSTTARIVAFWCMLLRLLVGAFVVSFWFCGGTILYLLMRRLCDGQDPGELWMPGGAAAPLTAPGAGAIRDEI